MVLDVEKLAEMEKRARELLSSGEFAKAEKAYARLLRYDDSAPLRNNLAFARYMQNNRQGALEALEPCLRPGADTSPPGNPFTYALAARIYWDMGQEDAARYWLDRAVRAFEEGLSLLRRGKLDQDRHSFCEYSVAVMRAAGHLGDHRLVFDLYRRWEMHHVRWENKFYAGVAAFNMGRYKRAASFLASLGGVSEMFLNMQQVALLAERGAVPPLTLSYDADRNTSPQSPLVNEVISRLGSLYAKKEGGEIQAEEVKIMEETISHPDIKFLLLCIAYGMGDQVQAGQIIYNLVRYGGDWGRELAERLMQQAQVDDSWKVMAAEALIDRGLLSRDDPVEMVFNGQKRAVVIKRKEVPTGPEEEKDRVVDRAQELEQKGDKDGAIKLLRELLSDCFYPPAALKLSCLLYQKGGREEMEEAVELLKALHELNPVHPGVLYNLSLTCYQLGKLEEALYYYDMIDPKSVDKEHREMYRNLGYTIASKLAHSYPEVLLQGVAEDFRKEVEDKPLPLGAALSRGLKNMPSNWLVYTCSLYGLEPARLRREREKQIAEFLLEPENLKKAVSHLSEEEAELLRFLLGKGGWAKLNVITRKFGPMEGDGYFWGEEGKQPVSVLGRLWARALVLVGKANLQGRRCKVAVVPADLRECLAGLVMGTEQIRQ